LLKSAKNIEFVGIRMDKNTVLTAINFFEKCLTQKGINISKIILFGSYANATPDMKAILI